MKVAINGFGRIGRAVFRVLNAKPGVEVVAINDLAAPEALAHLLKYDTVMGTLRDNVTLDGDTLRTETQTVKMLSVRQPAELPWKALGVDFAIESSGVFRKREQIAAHLQAGASKVVLTVPSKDEIDATVVLGVNDHELRPEHKIVSNASCTTNCLAPVAAVLDSEFGIDSGLMTTVHAYTNDQSLADVAHPDLRRARAAAQNIIPTSTGAAKAVGKVLPQLKGKLDGMAMRVPVLDGSIVDLVAVLRQDVTVERVNEAMKAAAQSDRLKGILQYNEAPLVSSDILGNSHSSIFDAPWTSVVNGNLVKILSWYDNEWGYSNRVADLLALLERVG